MSRFERGTGSSKNDFARVSGDRSRRHPRAHRSRPRERRRTRRRAPNRRSRGDTQGLGMDERRRRPGISEGALLRALSLSVGTRTRNQPVAGAGGCSRARFLRNHGRSAWRRWRVPHAAARNCRREHGRPRALQRRHSLPSRSESWRSFFSRRCPRRTRRWRGLHQWHRMPRERQLALPPAQASTVKRADPRIYSARQAGSRNGVDGYRIRDRRDRGCARRNVADDRFSRRPLGVSRGTCLLALQRRAASEVQPSGQRTHVHRERIDTEKCAASKEALLADRQNLGTVGYMPRLEFDAAKRETGRAVEGGVLMRAGSAYCRAIALLLFFFPLFSPAYVQTTTAPSAREGTREQRAPRAFEKTRDNPPELHAFLVPIPQA